MGAFEELLGHVVDLEFVTHEAMIKAALHWELEEYQLDSGVFRGYINAVHTSHIQIANTFRSNGIFLKGKTPRNAYLFASVKSEGCMTHNGLSILEDELVVLDEKDTLDFVVSSAVNDVTIAIDKDFFDEAFKEFFNEPFQYDRLNKRIQLKANSGTTFRTSVKNMVSDLILQNVKLKNDLHFHKKAEYAILQILFGHMDLSRKRSRVLESEMNANKVRKYIEKNYKDSICINDLCHSEKLSERTLRLNFKNLFGLSPKQYLKSYRLGKVHHAFLQGDHHSDTVEDIAYHHGFTHMGRFSQCYSDMFGNSPSYTLRKSPPHFN